MKDCIELNLLHSISQIFACSVLVSMLLLLPEGVAAQWTTNGDNINNTNTGNVGIGTTGPAKKLVVESDTVNDHISIVRPTTNPATFNFGIDNTGPFFESVTANKPISFYTHNGSSIAERIRIDKDGNVGIGTTNPAGILHIAKATSVVFQMSRTDAGTDEKNWYIAAQGGALYWGLNNDALNNGTNYAKVSRSGFSATQFDIMTNAPGGAAISAKSTGNVGIGTTNPAQALEVNSGGGTRARITIANGNSGGTEFYSSGGIFKGGLLYYSPLNITSLYGPDSGASAIDLTSAGNVGIGTTSPTTKLHVVGDVTVTGNIAAKYQDIAEWVPSASMIPAGTVVVLDPTKSNEVIACSQAYDTRVAGVISEQPGLTLGEGGEGKVLVATTGRVRVKVDATNAPIRVGDLLVTSDKGGLAMKSVPVDLGGVQFHRPGTLIGKALEPLEQGTGEILVLLSLQ